MPTLSTPLIGSSSKSKSIVPSFIVDDVMSTAGAAKVAEGLIFREQNRNYLRLDDKLIEIVTRDDAKFLYLEGRIKKFALLEPSEAELDAMKDFYGADDADILIF